MQDDKVFEDAFQRNEARKHLLAEIVADLKKARTSQETQPEGTPVNNELYALTVKYEGLLLNAQEGRYEFVTLDTDR